MQAESEPAMKSKIGIFCMILGAALVLGAVGLFQANQAEDQNAQDAVVELMPQLVDQIRQTEEATSEEPVLELQVPVELLTEEDKQMMEVEIDGHLYIGYLSIPDLGLDLPVMSSWSYPQLDIAPCRYAGSILGEDLVIMAHNYRSHFANLSQLEQGDSVYFTEVDGTRTAYEVVGKDVLQPEAVEEMTAGDFDLTLFTCTYGGASRVTIYCDQVK